MRLPSQDSATGRAVKTAFQSIVGLLITLIAIPGVPEALTTYAREHTLPFLVFVGVPAGVVSFVMNFVRKDVSNY